MHYLGHGIFEEHRVEGIQKLVAKVGHLVTGVIRNRIDGNVDLFLVVHWSFLLVVFSKLIAALSACGHCPVAGLRWFDRVNSEP